MSLLKLIALEALDRIVYRLTNKQYTIMPVDALDAARGPINSVVTYPRSSELDELDDEIYNALCGRWCEIRNRIHDIRNQLPWRDRT